MIVYNLIDGTPVRDYMILKAYKTATDLTKVEDKVKGIVDGGFNEQTIEKVADILKDTVEGVTDLEYLQEHIQNITSESDCDAIWILPIPEGLIDSFLHSYSDDTDENGNHNLQGVGDSILSKAKSTFNNTVNQVKNAIVG